MRVWSLPFFVGSTAWLGPWLTSRVGQVGLLSAEGLCLPTATSATDAAGGSSVWLA